MLLWLEKRILTAFDWAFVLFGAALLFFMSEGLITFAWITALPVLWLLLRRHFMIPSIGVVCAMILIFQLPFVMAAVATLSPPPLELGDIKQYAVPGFWLGLIIWMALLVVRAVHLRDADNVIGRALPLALVACFIAISIEKFAGVIEGGCRVRGFTPWVFVPPLFFYLFSIVTFAHWDRTNGQGRVLRLLLVAMSVLIALGYTGSRGILLGQLLAFGALTGWFILARRDVWGAIGVLVMLAIGIAGSVVTDFLTGCSNAERLSRLLTVVGDSDLLSVDSSLSSRASIFSVALETALERPWLGHGIWYEHFALDKAGLGRHPHVHNQYLSWIIWGGLPALLSGIGFLVAPLFVVLRMTDTWAKGIMLIAILGPLPLSQLTDTFYRHEGYLYLHVFAITVIMVLAFKWNAGDVTRGGEEPTSEARH